MDRCADLIRSYSEATSGLKLRPYPVPIPIWWMSVATLARMDPRLYSLWTEEADESACGWWRGLDRSGECEVCGRPAEEIDEVWEYRVSDDGAVARLVGLRKICRACHLAKHLNLAERAWTIDRVIEWLGEVNGLSRAEVLEIVRLAGASWECFNRVLRSRWRFELPAVEGMEARRALENILNSMAKSELYDVARGWVWTVENDLVRPVTAEEALESAPTVAELVERSEALGLVPLRQELEHAIELLRSGVEREDFSASLTPVGEWIALLPTPQTVRLFKRVAEEIASRDSPALQAKVSVERGERKAIVVYTPNFLDVGAIVETAEWLEGLGTVGPLTYKPDVFTMAGIRPGHPRLRPHVYEFMACGEEPVGSLEQWI